MGKYHDMLFGGEEASAPVQSGKYNAMLFGDATPPPAEQSTPPVESNTLLENLATGAGKGIAGIPSLPRTMADIAKSGEQAIAEKVPGFSIPPATPIGMALAVKDLWPSFEETHSLLTKMGWENKKANTTADKYQQSIGEFVAGNPSAKARTIVGNLASSVLSETAGQATEGSKYEWLARMFGALAGGAVTEGASSTKSITADVLQDRLKGVSAEDFTQAKALQKQSQELGVPLSGAEAIDSAPLQKLAGDVAASPYGQATMEQAFKSRPLQVKEAVTSMKDAIAPEAIPQEVAAKATQAATQSIKSAEIARSQATRPLYEAANLVQIPKKQITPIVTQINEQLKLTTNPALKKELESLSAQIEEAKGNLGMLNSIRKDFRDRIDTPAFGADNLSKEASSKVTPILKQIDEALIKSSDAYAEANALHAKISKEVIEPLMASGVGKVAGKGFDPKDTQNINNALSVLTDIKSARPRTISQVATELNKVDKTVFPSMVRVVLDNSFDKASKKLLSGENRNAGALFAKEVYGTPQQAENLQAMIKQTALSNGNNPNATWKGFENLMTVLERTGRIPGVGSQTTPRRQLNTELSRSKLAATGDLISTSPLSSVNKAIRQWQEQGRYKELAQILTDPNSVEKIEQLARMQPNSRKARFLVSQVLNLSREAGQEENR